MLEIKYVILADRVLCCGINLTLNCRKLFASSYITSRGKLSVYITNLRASTFSNNCLFSK